jgi:uncharacterized protein (TIGR00725 family)
VIMSASEREQSTRLSASEREQSTRPYVSVSVIGSSACDENTESWRLAEEVGRLLGEAGATVFCGGGGGVMEAVARGASGVGGTVVGILPGVAPEEANRHWTHVVATGVGQARNLAVVASGDVTIAVGGEWGTLTEIAHARGIGRPVIALRSWSVSGQGEMEAGPGVIATSTAEEAVSAALDVIAD